jgi:hypothetical protein
MATNAELKKALRNAHNAGDKESATRIAKILASQEQADLAKLEESIERLPKAPRPSPLDVAKDVVVSPIKGTVLGSAGMAGLPGLAQSGISSMMGKDISEAPPSMMAAPLLKSQDIMNLIERIPGAKRLTQYQAKTPLGKPLQTLGEFVGPAIPFTKPFQAGGLERMGRALKIGGAAAVPAYALEDYPYAAIPASLLAGGGVALATAPSRAAEAAQAVLKDVSPAKLALAKEVQKQANELEIPLTAPEIIDSDLLRDLGNIVYGSGRGGQIMSTYIANRPEKIKEVAADLVEQIAKDPTSLRKTYKDIGEVAEKSIRNVRKERTKKAQQWYKISNDEFVEEDQVLSIIDKIEETIKGLDSTDPTRAKLQNLKQGLIKKEIKPKDQPQILDEFGKPFITQTPKTKIIPQTNINTLDNILKRFEDMVVDSRANIAKEERYIEKSARSIFSNEDKSGFLNLIDDTLRTNPNYSKAKDVYAQLSDELVQPVIDNIAPLAKNNITPATIKGFIFNPERNNVDDIRKTYEILNKTDPNAFPNLVRAYVKASANKKLVLKETGESKKSGFDLWKILAGTDDASANFNTALKGVAEAQGANPNNLVLGFQKFNEVLKRTARLANVDNPSSPPKEGLLLRDVAQIGSFMWHVKFAAKFERYTQNKTIEDLANIFVRPDSVKQLEKLAKINPASEEAQRIVRNILYVTNNIKTQEERDREAYIEKLQSGDVQPQVAIPAQ